jgi:Fe-S-cluster-containing dehydrogenase component
MQNYWEKNPVVQSEGKINFAEFWNSAIHNGIYEPRYKENFVFSFNTEATAKALASTVSLTTGKPELLLYTNVAVGTGKHANNPWLQELPDPVSKTCWDNYAAISPQLAGELGLKEEQLVSVNGMPALPVLIQPGQEYLTVSVALGYGRENSGIPANGVGVNMFPMLRSADGTRVNWTPDISLEVTGGIRKLARTQTHHSMEGRALVREASLEEYIENPQAGNEVRLEIKEHLKSLYPKAEFDGYHWGMAIDLNLCTGCNACVVACSAENNVPVVGREQVIKAQEMHWIRIDRYYTGDPANPEVVRQPVMCQHCDNAPCENVCPVAATTHSNEGLNQMAYNRCIGTRYCNNNCPYKVRRFNFLDYTGADAIRGNRYDPAEMTTDLRRLVLNPDVTVRAKGVIEKCSFCVQRIQEKKLTAKNENRPLQDGEVTPACAQACPAGAIIFGNLNDKNSEVSKMYAQERNYHLLEELHTLPSVGYMTKIKNKTI